MLGVYVPTGTTGYVGYGIGLHSDLDLAKICQTGEHVMKARLFDVR
jgi:hypothetical protein